MKETAIIRIEKRVDMNSRVNRRLRKNGFLPGIILGKGMDSIPVLVGKEELKSKLLKHGRNAVYQLDLPKDKTYTVLVKEIQNSYRGDYIHVDFQTISFAEEVRADVAIKLIGKELLEAKRLMVMQQIDTIAVKGLPQNVPDVIEIDITKMQGGESIDIGNINFPEGIVSEADPEQIVVAINEARTQNIESEDKPQIVSEDNANEKTES